MDSKNRIDQVFEHLDRWRHLPSYQLERRADIFFSLYLPEILKQHSKCGPWTIIPEFPVHNPAKDPDAKTNRSAKIDYLGVTHTLDRLVFVELKTDSGSIRREQVKYLLAAQDAQTKNKLALLNKLKKICEATKEQEKYGWLLKELSEVGLIDLLPSGTFKPRRDLPITLEAEILFIKPDNEPMEMGINCISFEEVAEIILKTNKDYLSMRFVQSLRKWAGEPVGRKGRSYKMNRKD